MTQLLTRVVLYARVSTAGQDCARQVADLAAYVDQAQWIAIGTYQETESGRKDDRPERKKVLALAQARKIDVVVVTELTRWGRSTADLLNTLQTLHNYGVRLVSITGVSFDLASPQGRLIAALLSALAEFEADLTRERVVSGLANARRKGKKLGRQAGQNVKRDRIRARVQKLIEEGLSIRAIARHVGASPRTVNLVVQELKAIGDSPELAHP